MLKLYDQCTDHRVFQSVGIHSLMIEVLNYIQIKTEYLTVSLGDSLFDFTYLGMLSLYNCVLCFFVSL